MNKEVIEDIGELLKGSFKETDRLDHLANQFYGDINLWWYIAKANNLKFITIPIGSRLRIPVDAGRAYSVGR